MGDPTLEPFPLAPSFRSKIWGAHDLRPWFAEAAEKIGEVWFPADPAGLPLLVKFIFTSDRLSVQVHPDDEYARRHERSPGKSEMWHVLRADPGARIGVGLREPISPERLLAASLSGEIDDLLVWHAARAGDTYAIPAGTIHALSAGLVICEIQQPCDVTYRLYDYGRGRELHLEKAMDVALRTTHPGRSLPRPAGGSAMRLAECAWFVTESVALSSALDYEPDPERLHLLIFVEGGGTLAGRRFRSGEVWVVPGRAERFRIQPEGAARFLRTWVPAAAAAIPSLG